MKKITLLLGIVSLLLIVSVPAFAQRAGTEARVSPNAAVSQTIGTTVVTVEYGRPGVKDRAVWGSLVPNGEVWRAGANEATTISFSADVKIEGNALPAGTYSLFTIPGKDEWTVIFNKVAKQWGAYKYDAGQDALRVTVKPVASEHSEWLVYCFGDLTPTSGTLMLKWEKLTVPVKIEVAK